MSVKYCFPVSVFYFWPALMHPAVWSLCDSWASCFSLNVIIDRWLHCYKSIGTAQINSIWWLYNAKYKSFKIVLEIAAKSEQFSFLLM